MSKFQQVEDNWEQRYLDKDTPWYSKTPHYKVIDAVEKYLGDSGRILDVGCGYGTDAMHLAKLGYEVTAIDVANTAIERAKKVAAAEKLKINFYVDEFFKPQHVLENFQAVIDIASLHTFIELEGKKAYVERVHEILLKHGIWVNVSCIRPLVDEIALKEEVKAPPGIFFKELADIINNKFMPLAINIDSFIVIREGKKVDFPCWVSVFRKLS